MPHLADGEMCQHSRSILVIHILRIIVLGRNTLRQLSRALSLVSYSPSLIRPTVRAQPSDRKLTIATTAFWLFGHDLFLHNPETPPATSHVVCVSFESLYVFGVVPFYLHCLFRALADVPRKLCDQASGDHITVRLILTSLLPVAWQMSL